MISKQDITTLFETNNIKVKEIRDDIYEVLNPDKHIESDSLKKSLKNFVFLLDDDRNVYYIIINNNNTWKDIYKNLELRLGKSPIASSEILPDPNNLHIDTINLGAYI